MFFSINETAQIFGVDRGTVLGWNRRGCPRIDPVGPGKPAQLDFQAVLSWRKADLTQHLTRQWNSSDESITRIAEMEAAVRQRLKKLKK